MEGKILHPNGQIAWLTNQILSDGTWYTKGGKAWHSNGELAYLTRETLPNGTSYENGGKVWHSNGQLAKSDGSGIEIELGPGIRIFVENGRFDLYIYGQQVV